MGASTLCCRVGCGGATAFAAPVAVVVLHVPRREEGRARTRGAGSEHDAGALGVKVRASLRLMTAPGFEDHASWAFADRAQAVAARYRGGDRAAAEPGLLALMAAGEYEEAAKFIDLYISQWARIEAVGEDAFWFVNEAAYAFWEAGRVDDAMEMMSRLMMFGVEDNGSLISMAINRAQMLMHAADFDAALAAAEELEDLGEDFASDYGMMWIYDAKACSLHQLGREEEAQAVVDESIAPIAESNRAAHTKTMLCLEKFDDAAEMIVERLDDPDENTGLILSFSEMQKQGHSPPFLVES